MSVIAYFMNMVPYASGEPNPSGGFDFHGVSGVKTASPGKKVSIGMAFQFAVLHPIGATDLWRKVEVEHQGNIIAQSIEPIEVGRYGYNTFDVWGWTQQIKFTIGGMGLYRIFVYLQDGRDQPFDQCHAMLSVAFVSNEERNVTPQ